MLVCEIITELPLGVRQIPLTSGLFAIVDDADFERINARKWHARADGKTAYAYRTVMVSGSGESRVRRSVAMHREILELDVSDNRLVDHRDGNGLNNTRSNLRICDATRNARNNKRQLPPSGFRGVHFDKARGLWVAMIKIDGRKRNLGGFDSPADAARAYDTAVQDAAGEFAVTNEMMGAFHATI